MPTIKQIVFGSLSLLIIVAGGLSWYALQPSEAQLREARRVEQRHRDFTSALRSGRWENVWRNLSPAAQEQFQDDVQALLRMKHRSADTDNLEAADRDLRSIGNPPRAFSPSPEGNPVLFRRIAAKYFGGGSGQRGLSSIRVDRALLGARGVETVGEPRKASKRTLRFVCLEDQWLLDKLE